MNDEMMTWREVAGSSKSTTRLPLFCSFFSDLERRLSFTFHSNLLFSLVDWTTQEEKTEGGIVGTSSVFLLNQSTGMFKQCKVSEDISERERIVHIQYSCFLFIPLSFLWRVAHISLHIFAYNNLCWKPVRQRCARHRLCMPVCNGQL